MKRKDLTYYAIQYGGVPMTLESAKRFLIMSQLAGYSINEAIEFVPNELRSDKFKEKGEQK
jgi:hypothetical protein